MPAFLEQTADTLLERFTNLSDTVLILPSKRAGGQLKRYILNKISRTQFAPTILSVEEFIEHIAELRIIEPTELLFLTYKTYLQCAEISEKDDFDTYSQWASTLLADFNEMDRYLVPPKAFFDYMSSVKALDRWNLKVADTASLRSYLGFWEQLPFFYEQLREALLQNGKAYQGLVYRKAAEDIEHYVNSEGHKAHVFIGFNALNTAEQQIVRALLELQETMIFWDADEYFMEDPSHSASHFLREYLKKWNWHGTPPLGISNSYMEPKEFTFMEARKDIEQVKAVGSLLKGISKDELSETAIVLADESLLNPLLYSLPENIEAVNVTMGVPLKGTSEVHFLDLLLRLHTDNRSRYHFSQLESILLHPTTLLLFPDATALRKTMVEQNKVYCDMDDLLSASNTEDHSTLKLLFEPWKQGNRAVSAMLEIIDVLRRSGGIDRYQRAILFHINQVLIKINSLSEYHSYMDSIRSFHNIFTELISQSTLDLRGDSFRGLQIMGVLETRCLDFKNIILVSMNEGILPAGKQSNSFMTNDLKYQFGLPGYYEKDAIYAYHFYRLLHRAERVHFIYNVESDGLQSAEKSRFLWQLEIASPEQHRIDHKIIEFDSKTNDSIRAAEIPKTSSLMTRIEEIAASGFSPSALSSYVRDPLDFYFSRVLGIQERDEIEETIAARTLGNIVHLTLENLYRPMEGKTLRSEDLEGMLKSLDRVLQASFEKFLKASPSDKGKNVLVKAVAKRYVERVIQMDLKTVKDGQELEIISVETNYQCDIEVPELNFPVRLRGQIDRLDRLQGQLRIIDYKSGLVQPGDIEIVNWDTLASDYKFSKAFQVLCYALMVFESDGVHEAQAGVISFKRMSYGFMKFATKEKARSKIKNSKIDQAVLDEFQIQLKKVITEICDPSVAFVERTEATA